MLAGFRMRHLFGMIHIHGIVREPGRIEERVRKGDGVDVVRKVRVHYEADRHSLLFTGHEFLVRETKAFQFF